MIYKKAPRAPGPDAASPPSLVCRCCLQVLEPEEVQDLVEYKSHKDKGVTMAARSLIEVYRCLNPAALKKRDRGKGAGCPPRRAPRPG